MQPMDPPLSINNDDDIEEVSLLDDSDLQDQHDQILSPPIKIIKKERGHTLGEKSITQWASFIFIVNQIYGPGVLSIPVVFQQSGWFMTTLSLTFFLIVSCFASTLLCESLSMIPGNKYFDKHIEYSVAVKYYFGSKSYYIFQVLNNLCIQAYNIASIVICAQSLDQFFVFCFKKTFAFTFHPTFGFQSVPDANIFYSSGYVCITMGYLIICAVSIPTSFMNLNDNVKIVQTLSFVFLFVLIGEFIVQYFLNGIHVERVPTFGDNYYQLVSIFVFSWAYPMFIPSWVNEKKNNVSVNKAVWLSGVFSWFGYLFIGLLGAMAYPYLGTDNILNLMGLETSPTLTRIASYLFSLGVIMPGIPVCFITIRYNLYVGYICGKRSSYFWGVIVPWFVAFIFCQQTIFAQLLNWSSLILNSLVNFLFPFAIYLRATGDKFKKKHIIFMENEDPSDSVVKPFPRIVAKYHRQITWAIFIITLCISLTQIVYDIVKAIMGDNPLAN
ncbi:hypothetical protein CYY_001169 [Polysphondylium violaceum]|uniref:Amino acid transporter transmembrane domain-containing protein n=1 Tax=Polysphondylium violaceum TaxID=133409 RepID=A0A8J4UWH5_9MYCE|nr:hypothetical protein CYY_001169 [Polysphondylium violaceum]